ncbi:MAG TPA: epoxide hydrolase [Jatrophihabitans sp.]|jgi:pimeloyl-ACP methyl ester carboxylesterase|nr:epoxide hydrolase [Jatrophihabitans sp.]
MPDVDAAIRPFRIEIPEQDLTELHERLRRTRWAQELPGLGWDYGVPVDYLKDLVAYWCDGYDWRGWEARINSYPQFITTIDGQDVHFLHVRSAEPDAIPVILTHGWPGSVVDFLDIIGPLTSPREHGDATSPAFDLVLASLPGFGFSGPTRQPGWDAGRIAGAWAQLMRRLGYHRYGAGGNDAGSLVSVELARGYPEPLIGVHVTQIWSMPRGDEGELDGLSEADQAALDIRNWFRENLGAYDELHSQQPQTLAHALADSPVGLLAWYSQIYRDEVDRDLILTDVTMAWLTETVSSSLRLYYENRHVPQPVEPTRVPLGLAQFSDDFTSMHRFAERDHRNIVSWNCYDRPGHFAAHQSPDLLVADIRGFFGGLV